MRPPSQELGERVGNVIYAAKAKNPILMLNLFRPHGVFAYLDLNLYVYPVAQADDVANAFFARELTTPDRDRRVAPDHRSGLLIQILDDLLRQFVGCHIS